MAAPSKGTYFDGACLCGGLRFRAMAPSKWCAHCHCTMCQRAHGAAFVTWVGFEQERFDLLEDDTLIWYDSSDDAQRGFCSSCGASVLFRSSRWPGEIHIARAAIPGEIDRLPESHVSSSTQVAWITCDDHLPKQA